MSYSKNTILRFQPSDSPNHYTAVVIHDNNVLQVKPHSTKIITLSEWLSTLPGNPTEQALEVEEKERAPTWNVNRTHGSSLTWDKYIYNMIVRHSRQHLKNMELQNAFYRFSTALFDASHIINTGIYGRLTWKRGGHIIMKERSVTQQNMKDWELMPIPYWFVHYSAPNSRPSDFMPKIYEAYKPLYDLMEKLGILDYVRELRLNTTKLSMEKSICRAEGALYRIQQKKKKIESQEVYQMLQVKKLKETLQAM